MFMKKLDFSNVSSKLGGDKKQELRSIVNKNKQQFVSKKFEIINYSSHNKSIIGDPMKKTELDAQSKPSLHLKNCKYMKPIVMPSHQSTKQESIAGGKENVNEKKPAENRPRSYTSNIKNKNTRNEKENQNLHIEKKKEKTIPPMTAPPQKVKDQKQNSQPKVKEDVAQDVNPDNMTYEELLELEDKIGYVSKGYTEAELNQIPKEQFENTKDFKGEKVCTICQGEYKGADYLKQLTCNHYFHSDCVDVWLSKEKTCPLCKERVYIIFT